MDSIATTVTTTDIIDSFHGGSISSNNISLNIFTTSTLTGLATQSSFYGEFNNIVIDNNSGSNGTESILNSTLIPKESISFILPWWRQLLWSILFGGMVVVATGGNLIVIWIVLAHKRMRTVTNYFIVNLSVADAMVSTLNVIFNYIYMLNSNWPFGQLYCKISQFVSSLSICASVFTLMAIAIDRYMAIMNPLRHRMGKRCTLAIAAMIWITSIVISCPMFLFFTTESTDDGARVVCYAEWPDGQTNYSLQEYVYNIVLLFLTYFVPIGSMSYTYARVGIELWGSQSIGECSHRQLENIKNKRRVVKMMMVVVFIFAVCWLPIHVYFIVTSYYPDITNFSFIQEVYLAIYWLAMSNSMYNPIIYCWMNSRFRRGFKQFFRWCPFVNLSPDSLQRREVLTSRYSCSGSPDHNRIVRNDTERSILYTSCPSSRGGSVRMAANLSTNNQHHHHHHHQQHQQCSINSFGNECQQTKRNNTTLNPQQQRWTTNNSSNKNFNNSSYNSNSRRQSFQPS